jgi:hypothetical protein
MARQINMANGPEGLPPGDTLRMAMGQTNQWTQQLQEAQKQALAEKLGLGDLGLKQQEMALKQRQYEDLFDPYKALMTGVSGGKFPDPSSLSGAITALDQLRSWHGARGADGSVGAQPVTPSAGKGENGVAGGGDQQSAPPPSSPQTFPFWMQALPGMRDAQGNPATMKPGDIFNLIDTKAPQGWLADPANLQQAVNFAALHTTGGQDAIKHWAQGNQSLGQPFMDRVRTGAQRLIGQQPEFSHDEQLASAVRNGMGWQARVPVLTRIAEYNPLSWGMGRISDLLSSQ